MRTDILFMKAYRCFLLVCILLSAISVSMHAQPQKLMTLTARDAGGRTSNILCGFHQNATFDFDKELNESAVPPLPVSSVFDFRFLDPPLRPRTAGTGSYKDIRGFSSVADTFYVRCQPQNEGYPFEVRWMKDQSERFSTALILYTTGGKTHQLDMRENETATFSMEVVQPVRIVLQAAPRYGNSLNSIKDIHK